MPEVTNNLRTTVDVFVGVRDGAAQMETLAPGECRNIAVDVSSAKVRGQILAGNITVAKPTAKKPPKGSPEPSE